MPSNSDTFWSRVLFRDFIRHFRKMTPEQVAEDIAASMDALDDLNPDGDSFGSLMVRWANERMNGPFATAARENGKKGGRPPKVKGDACHREAQDGIHNGSNAGQSARSTVSTFSGTPEALVNQKRTGTAVPELRRAAHSPAPVRTSGPMPEDRQTVIDFAVAEGLDVDDACECWYVTINERDGLTADGKKINNWKAYIRKWCATRTQNRRTA